MRRGMIQRGATFLVLAWLVVQAVPARAQGPLGPWIGPCDVQTSVSFIDSALPMDQFRVRYDAAYNLDRPNRAEFFWPAPASTNAFRPVPERSVDYQDLSAYVEFTCCQHISLFFEAPVRFLNPAINDNTTGIGDLNAGAKMIFGATENGIISGQFRVYVPTGLGERGLGTDHVSLEPALLINRRLHPWLTFEGELRYWIPIQGNETFQGDVFRYGAGLVFGEQCDCGPWITPVAEFVGWVPMGGRSIYVTDTGLLATDMTRNQPILNGLFGFRAGVADHFDVYGGYGVALTGNHWYEETWRVDFRFKF